MTILMKLIGEENLHGCPATITITAKLPSETQVDSSRGQKLAALKDCYGDRAIQSPMTVKIFVGTDGFLPDSAGV